MRIGLVITAEPGERFTDGTKHARLAQVSMISVAACTPEEHEVVLIDEKVEPLEPLQEFDIVGITVHTAVAPRVYDFARRWKELGAYVVLGGPHVTALPEEAAMHADAVVVGDAEDTWPRVIRDFEKGRNERIYRSSYPDISKIRGPRYDLLEGKGYYTMAVAHATRGCPYRCEFCSVPNVFGSSYRYRPAQVVAEECKNMKGYIVMWDDNVMADREYFISLCEALKPLKRRWVTQATMVFANDRELVSKAADAGLSAVFLGMESFDKVSLKKSMKGFNKVQKYGQAIRNLHEHGIMAGAGIVFGFDNDDPGVFQRSLDAAAEIKLDAINFTMLTPFPGTPLFDRAQRENRMITYDWSRYQPTKYATLKPAKMTVEELAEGHRWALDQFYQAGPVVKRIWNTPLHARRFSFFVNWHYWRVKKTFWLEADGPGRPNPIPAIQTTPPIYPPVVPVETGGLAMVN